MTPRTFHRMLVLARHDTGFHDWFPRCGGGFAIIDHKRIWWLADDDEYGAACIELGWTKDQVETTLSARRFSHEKIVRYYTAYARGLPPESPTARRVWEQVVTGKDWPLPRTWWWHAESESLMSATDPKEYWAFANPKSATSVCEQVPEHRARQLYKEGASVSDEDRAYLVGSASSPADLEQTGSDDDDLGLDDEDLGLDDEDDLGL